MKEIIAGLAMLAAGGALADPVGTCTATTRGMICGGIATNDPVPLCLDGNMHVVPCAAVTPGKDTKCELVIAWILSDPDHPTISELTPVCADEADVAASQTVTKIIKLER